MGKALEASLKNITDRFGDGTIMQGSNIKQIIPVISTGCLGIDIALGVGGLPRGRISELYGPNGSGKTSLALHTVAEAQRMNLNVAYIDVEHALDSNYAQVLGVNMERLFLSQPDCGEDSLEITEILIRSGEIGMIVVDSVDALVPRAVIDGEMEDKHVAGLARLMSQALRKLAGIVKKTNVCLVFINQLRSAVQMQGYGPSEVTSGGVALKYYSSVRAEIRSIGKITDNTNTETIGNKTRIKVVKNKVASPFKEVEVELIFGRGLSKEGSLLDIALDSKICKRSGAWYSYKDISLGQGKQAAVAFLAEEDKIRSDIRAEVLQAKGMSELEA